jgi:hypothetical protein
MAAGVLLAASGVQRERALLSGPFTETVREREARAAARPGDPDTDRALAQAYLDVGQPGLAVALLRDAAIATGDTGGVRTRHLYGRALIEDGKGLEALSIEQRVVAACAPLAEGEPAPAGCDAALLASALRRVDILRELAAMGVSDVVAHPEAGLIAYRNATREVRVAMQ